MTLPEECKNQLMKEIMNIVDSVKDKVLKEEKGSLNKELKNDIRTISIAYMALAYRLLTEQDAVAIARYLYFEFEKPSLSYLGFATPAMFPY